MTSFMEFICPFQSCPLGKVSVCPGSTATAHQDLSPIFWASLSFVSQIWWCSGRQIVLSEKVTHQHAGWNLASTPWSGCKGAPWTLASCILHVSYDVKLSSLHLSFPCLRLNKHKIDNSQLVVFRLSLNVYWSEFDGNYLRHYKFMMIVEFINGDWINSMNFSLSPFSEDGSNSR